MIGRTFPPSNNDSPPVPAALEIAADPGVPTLANRTVRGAPFGVSVGLYSRSKDVTLTLSAALSPIQPRSMSLDILL